MWQFLPMVVAGAGMVLFELEQIFLRIEEFYGIDNDKKEVKA